MMVLLRGDRYRFPCFASRVAVVCGALGFLSGCGTLGSGTIVAARTPVNEAVATTSRQQTLMNIVRVYHNESPVILDVVESDETAELQAQATGGVMGIGATAGHTGSAGGTLTGSDSVLTRYAPLQGQALISQLSTQITVETLNALYDSDWPIQSIIEFAIDKLTPDNDDYDLAEDLLTELDRNYAIALATAKSGFSSPAAPKQIIASRAGPITISTQAPPAGGGDTLNVYLDKSSGKSAAHPRQDLTKTAWHALEDLYTSTQPDQKGTATIEPSRSPNLIELRNSPRTHLADLSREEFHHAHLGPVMRTRTGIGILKYIVTQPDVAFVSPAEYERIRHLPWNKYEFKRGCGSSEFYILSPGDDPTDQSARQESENGLNTYFSRNLLPKAGVQLISKYLHSISSPDGTITTRFNPGDHACPFSYGVIPPEQTGIGDKQSFATNLGFLKRFILVVRSETAPSDSFASWYSRGMYYAIMPDDIVSQRNLMLVSQFLTIQATATPSPALTTISATGR